MNAAVDSLQHGARKLSTRPRGRAIRVWVTVEEADEIEGRAGSAGLSLSGYLRALGLGYRPKSMFDQDAVLELAKLNADQGRLGGLLKLWLSNEERGRGASVGEVYEVLQTIKALQRRLAEVVGLVRAK